MQAGKFDLQIREIEGFFLLAPVSYWNASKEEIENKTGGCGPGKIGDWFVPDTMFGESVFLACQIHDWMYGEGASVLDKYYADLTFLWNMVVLIQSTPFFPGQKEKDTLDIGRLRTVMTYFEAVSYGGGDAFDKGETPKGEIA